MRTEERERWRQLMRTHHYLGLTRGCAKRHPGVTVVAIAVSAALSGGRGFNAIAEWAKESV